MPRIGYAQVRVVCWMGIAGVAVAVPAALLTPDRLLARLDGPAERFRDDLVRGIESFAWDLVGPPSSLSLD